MACHLFYTEGVYISTGIAHTGCPIYNSHSLCKKLTSISYTGSAHPAWISVLFHTRICNSLVFTLSFHTVYIQTNICIPLERVLFVGLTAMGITISCLMFYFHAHIYRYFSMSLIYTVGIYAIDICLKQIGILFKADGLCVLDQNNYCFLILY